MNIEIIKLIGLFVSSLFTGIFVSMLSVRLALNRFYSEKWWERKYEAYSKIFESLFDVKRYLEDYQDAELQGRDIPEERGQQLRSASQQARDNIYKAETVWAFILSEKATNCLKNFRSQMNKAREAQSWWENLEMELDAIEKCIETLHQCASQELKVSTRQQQVGKLTSALRSTYERRANKKRDPNQASAKITSSF